MASRFHAWQSAMLFTAVFVGFVLSVPNGLDMFTHAISSLDPPLDPIILQLPLVALVDRRSCSDWVSELTRLSRRYVLHPRPHGCLY